jgi:large subunit ribosomal protein L10
VGVVDGQLLDPQSLKAVADLPSREALRGQVVGMIQGPLAQLIGVLQAPQRELAYVLSERGKGAPAA